MSYEGSVTSIAFSPNGELVLIKGGDVVSVWELSSGQEITRMSDIRSFALSPDGKWVASSSWNDALWIWTASSGEEIIRMSGNKVTSVAFSPDGKWLVSGSFDGTARVWEASSGQEIARMSHEDTVYSVAFSPDGKWVLSYSGFLTTTVRVWLWRPQDLISLACSRLDRNLTREEWAQYIPGEAYRRTCPELP
jgi:WD40 repeat protein